MTALLDDLVRARDGGRKLLVPYLMGGIPDASGFQALFEAVAGYADAVEIGLPFSDPLMDGPVIAAAGERALRAGIGPRAALELAASLPDHTPRVAMTYYNPIHRVGEREFCAAAARAGITGLIVPDLPLEESETLRKHSKSAGLAWIPLVAPTSSQDRVARLVATATGFVYAVSTLGVTGTRTSLSERAAAVVELCLSETDAPVLVGIGVSNAQQAVEAVSTADGVVVGSALVKLVTESSIEDGAHFVRDLRAALDTI